MKTLIDMVIITMTVCFVTDVSGFVQSIKRMYLRKVWKMRRPDITDLDWKPFDCSLCLSLYCMLAYMAVTGHFTLGWLAVCVLLSMSASNISGFMLCIKDLLAALETLFQKLISKI